MSKTIETNQPNEQYGLVISYFGSSVSVEADDGQVFQCHLRRNQPLPVVGDRVRWQLEKDHAGIVTAIEMRRSLLARGDSKGNLKPIAANIDSIIIVMSPPPVFSEYLIDRYGVAATLLNINPLILLNKIDLLDQANMSAVLERLAPYQAFSYPVILSSVMTADGLNELGVYLKDKTSVLVGPSGVGKSSIIAALSQSDVRVRGVSPKGAGKHTTTATKLYHLPMGGHLIDSPGVREFNLWTISKTEVLQGFQEFAAFVGNCKFRDCLHTVEPGCGVQKAVTEGYISSERFKSYLSLMQGVQNKKSK